jgi:hypothetical protein
LHLPRLTDALARKCLFIDGMVSYLAARFGFELAKILERRRHPARAVRRVRPRSFGARRQIRRS